MGRFLIYTYRVCKCVLFLITSFYLSLPQLVSFSWHLGSIPGGHKEIPHSREKQPHAREKPQRLSSEAYCKKLGAVFRDCQVLKSPRGTPSSRETHALT